MRERPPRVREELPRLATPSNKLELVLMVRCRRRRSPSSRRKMRRRRRKLLLARANNQRRVKEANQLMVAKALKSSKLLSRSSSVSCQLRARTISMGQLPTFGSSY